MGWGERSVLGYAKKQKEKSRALARPGIDKSVRHQAMGKVCECAFCLYIGRDPKTLDWGRKCDRGWDVNYRKKLIDVKGSKTMFLIWPVTKNRFLAKSPADILVGVCARDWFFHNDPIVLILGWVTKQRFIREHHTAPPPDLDPGTKFMFRDQLEDISCLTTAVLRGKLK
jgi:hypothetical protein